MCPEETEILFEEGKIYKIVYIIHLIHHVSSRMSSKNCFVLMSFSIYYVFVKKEKQSVMILEPEQGQLRCKCTAENGQEHMADFWSSIDPEVQDV